MKKLLVCFLLCIPLCMQANKKTISLARDYIRSGKNLEKAEGLLCELLQDPVYRGNDKIWKMLFDAQQKQYEQFNEKLYLQQNIDTAAFFQVAHRMFNTLEGLDSVEQVPTAKGKIKMKYREQSAAILNQYRPNLFNGGIFFARNQDYQQAYTLLNSYISCAEKPLFKDYHYAEKDANLPVAAYWSVYCGYKMHDAAATLRYATLAEKDQTHADNLLQYLTETYWQQRDTTRYLQILRKGFQSYPHNPFYFSHLVEYYHTLGDDATALDYCNRALQTMPNNVRYRLTKSSLLLNMGRYQECLQLSKKLIAENDTLADAQLYAGLAIFNQTIILDKSQKYNAKQRAQILELYREARPYLERYRQLKPDQKKQWALPLYTIYMNLNMEKEFIEMEKLL